MNKFIHSKKNEIKRKQYKQSYSQNTMVKNITGGNKNKGQARKNVKGNNHFTKVRISLNEMEIYAQVTKFFGNRFEALDIHGKTKSCAIPGKFSGRNAKDNKIAVNTWVLIGEREWQVSETPVYDLLEVYNDAEKNYLKKNVHANWSIFESDDEKTSYSNIIEFGNDANEYTDIIQREAELTSQKHVEVNDESNDWIDVDDI